MEGKKTKGKQKIEMKMIENTDDRLITFSKRKSGIYKKASELVTLTGAEVAFVVFSPAGKPFSFAHPSVESVVGRFLGQKHEGPSDDTKQVIEAHRQTRINDLNNQHNHLIEKLEAEKEKMKDLKTMIATGGGEHMEGWWETPIEELNPNKLVEVKGAYTELLAEICAKIQEKTGGGASTSSAPPNPNPNPNPNVDVDHLGLGQMSGHPFEAAAANGGGGGGSPAPGPAPPSDHQGQWGGV